MTLATFKVLIGGKQKMLPMQLVEIGLCSDKTDGWTDGYVKDNLQVSAKVLLQLEIAVFRRHTHRDFQAL
jgi:hypothetical protein